MVMVAENGFVQSLCTQEAGSGREGEDKINQKFHELQKAATAQRPAGRWQHLSTGDSPPSRTIRQPATLARLNEPFAV